MTREELIDAVYRRVKHIPEHMRICADYIDALNAMYHERHGKNVTELFENNHMGDGNEMMWVPVTERLPEIEVDVLICDHNVPETGFVSFDTWHFSDGREARNVTHWMPLPDPPKE